MPLPIVPTPHSADDLNRDCRCVTVAPESLERAIDEMVRTPGFYARLRVERPYLFSHTAVFLSTAHAERIRRVVAAVYETARCPAYTETVLTWAPPLARFDPGPQGVFMGFDFHLGANGPKLIEINTNAGGPLLNALLAQAQRACSDELRETFSSRLVRFDKVFLDTFEQEWRRAGQTGIPHTVAIVDDAPAQQYLYPEFKLFAALFEQAGWQAVIADARELRFANGALWFDKQRIDLVYNRLTDFALEQPEHAVLRAAYESRAAVITPHPRAHALFADKRNLAVLSDAITLCQFGLAPEVAYLLADAIPQTLLLQPENATGLWQERKDWFFKPAASYGSKGAYRGDKLTRKTWHEIRERTYVAQRIVAPSLRIVHVDQIETSLKLDIRAYSYDGTVQLLAARLYQGQTTNFRTQGGGFAPVFILVD